MDDISQIWCSTLGDPKCRRVVAVTLNLLHACLGFIDIARTFWIKQIGVFDFVEWETQFASFAGRYPQHLAVILCHKNKRPF